MELLPLCLCLVSLSGSTFADGNDRVIRLKEASDVTLPCSINKNILLERFEWKKDGKKDVYLCESGSLSGQDDEFRGRVSHFDHELQNGNASITISDTKVSDTGDYTCNFPNLHQTFSVRLLVGACSEPRITIFQEKEGKVPLECKVSDAAPGFKLNISWFNKYGTKLNDTQIEATEKGKNYVLQTTVTKSDTYRCVATMEEISHRVQSETHVHVPGSSGLRVAPCLITVVLFLALLVTVG